MKAVIFPLIPIQEHIWNSFSTHTSPYHISLLALLPYSAISIFGRDFKAHKEKYFLHCKPDLAQSMSYRREDSSGIETAWQNIISLGFPCYLRLTLDTCCIKWTTKKKKCALAACSSWIFRYFLQQPSASLQREGSCDAASTVRPTRVQTDLWVNQCVRFLQWDYRFNLTKEKYAYQNSMTVIKRFSSNIPSVD